MCPKGFSGLLGTLAGHGAACFGSSHWTGVHFPPAQGLAKTYLLHRAFPEDPPTSSSNVPLAIWLQKMSDFFPQYLCIVHFCVDTPYLSPARPQTPYKPPGLSSHLCSHFTPSEALAVESLRRICVLVSQGANMIPKATEAKSHRT